MKTLTSFALCGYLGWELAGWIGLASSLAVFGAGMALIVLRDVYKYYWNNPHRSRWNAFLYLLGIGK